MGVAYHAASIVYLVRGDWATALGLIERQIATLRSGNVIDELPTALAHSARALGYLGRHDAALERIRQSEQALARQPKAGTAGDSPLANSLGRAHLLAGRVDEARRLARHAVDAALGRVDVVPQALHLLGDIVTHPDGFDAERGQACYREALALAEPRGMRPLVAHCHLGLGRLHQRAGSPSQARGHLTAAIAAYRELGMDYWLAQAEAASARS
jgi:tetratricopeptide (TPR) repeat protein